VRPDIVTVLADSAEHADEIDLARAEEARKRAEESLRAGPPPGSEAYLAAEASLRRSNLRLQVARRRRGLPDLPRGSGSS
ncbi:MAG: ATP synthase delta/epsilon chain alpha-helix domain-containing protein, partial [Anaerolineales bacterium]